jgi:hypothetical protein
VTEQSSSAPNKGESLTLESGVMLLAIQRVGPGRNGIESDVVTSIELFFGACAKESIASCLTDHV